MVFRETSRSRQHQQTTPIEYMGFEPCGTVPTFHSITSLFTSGFFFFLIQCMEFALFWQKVDKCTLV